MSSPFRFPGESDPYRRARNRLLEAKIDLRRRVEEVAARRRQLPLSGEAPEDYVFEELLADLNAARTVQQVRLSQLFQPGKDTLAIYNSMFGLTMKAPCPMCSRTLDSLNATAVHAVQRMSLAVVAKAPLERIHIFARDRGWSRLRLISSAANNYNRDYYGENQKEASSHH